MKMEIVDIEKRYGSIIALKHINASFEEGIYGLLGANGAGKSTLLNLITDNVERDKGGILLDGKDILSLGATYRSLIGYMPQQQGFYEQFTARQFLKYMAKLKGISKKTERKEIEMLLDRVHLSKEADMKISGFSGGMRQRVLLAQALLGDPKILIMDEPTAGLDPKERISFRNMVSELSTDKIIIFSTHIVEDIECISDYVLLLKAGELIKLNTPGKLIGSVAGKIGELCCSKEELFELRLKYPSAIVLQRREQLRIRIARDVLPEGFIQVDDIGLEDVYLYYFESAS